MTHLEECRLPVTDIGISAWVEIWYQNPEWHWVAVRPNLRLSWVEWEEVDNISLTTLHFEQSFINEPRLRLSSEAYEEEIHRLLLDEDFVGAARLKAMCEKDYEDIDFCLYIERSLHPRLDVLEEYAKEDGTSIYHEDINLCRLWLYQWQGVQPVCASACLQGTTRSHELNRGHLGNVFHLEPVAQDGE